MENTELAKSLLPLITFALGVILTPFIEVIKEKTKWKALRKNLFLEMGDELGELPRRLRMMSDTLSALNSFKSGKIQKDKPIKYIPRSTSLYFLKTATEASFSSFNKDQRYAIKSLFAQSSGLDDYIANMKETNVSKETAQECIDNCKRYLYTGCCMLNTMRIVVSSPLATSIADDEATINSVLSELNIDLNFEDLIITSTSNL